MAAYRSSRTNWSEWIWPVARVAMVQMPIMLGIAGNLVGWLVMALLVD